MTQNNQKLHLLNMLSHLTAYNLAFQLYKISTVLGWSSSSNLALVVLAPFKKWGLINLLTIYLTRSESNCCIQKLNKSLEISDFDFC